MAETSNGSWTRLPLAALIGLGIGLAAGGAGAGYVWWTGQQDLAQLQTELDDLQSTSDQALAEHQKVLDAKMQEGVDRTVRIELARTLDALDRSNFGTAQDHLKAAKDALAKASAPVQEAGKSLGAMTLEVGEDTGSQRDAIAQAARAVDGALK